MFRHILLTVFIVLSTTVIIFISCGKPVEHSTYSADFEGRVIDADTLTPIEGAEVLCHPLDNVGDTVVFTDTAGIYKFSGIHTFSTAGNIELTVTKNGYITFKKRYTISTLNYNTIPDIYLFPESDKK